MPVEDLRAEWVKARSKVLASPSLSKTVRKLAKRRRLTEGDRRRIKVLQDLGVVCEHGEHLTVKGVLLLPELCGEEDRHSVIERLVGPLDEFSKWLRDRYGLSEREADHVIYGFALGLDYVLIPWLRDNVVLGYPEPVELDDKETFRRAIVDFCAQLPMIAGPERIKRFAKSLPDAVRLWIKLLRAKAEELEEALR